MSSNTERGVIPAPLDVTSPDLHPDYEHLVPEHDIVRLPRALGSISTAVVHRKVPIRPNDSDLTKQHAGRPIGQQIIVAGRVTDAEGNPIPDTLIEIWQCNASGAYVDKFDPGEKPLDPNFTGGGRYRTGPDGTYRFVTIQPAAYSGPEGTHIPFRPAHIHISFIGPDLTNRLITQIYFESDPFFATDFVIAGMSELEEDPGARERLVARFDDDLTEIGGPDASVGYRWNVVLDGTSTPMEW